MQAEEGRTPKTSSNLKNTLHSAMCEPCVARGGHKGGGGNQDIVEVTVGSTTSFTSEHATAARTGTFQLRNQPRDSFQVPNSTQVRKVP